MVDVDALARECCAPFKEGYAANWYWLCVASAYQRAKNIAPYIDRLLAEQREAERAHIVAWMRQGESEGFGNTYTIGRHLADELEAGWDRLEPDDVDDEDAAAAIRGAQ